MNNDPVKRPSKTMADLFCDIYVEMDPNPRRGGYISLAPLVSAKNKRYADDPKLLFVPGAIPKIFKRDDFPVHHVRTRYCKALRKCGDNFCRLFIVLNQVFNEEAIKLLFPEPNLWLMHHNFMARRKSAREFNEANRAAKLIPKKEMRWHKGCVAATANRSASAHARYKRSLQRP